MLTSGFHQPEELICSGQLAEPLNTFCPDCLKSVKMADIPEEWVNLLLDAFRQLAERILPDDTLCAVVLGTEMHYRGCMTNSRSGDKPLPDMLRYIANLIEKKEKAENGHHATPESQRQTD